jgi:hypothetical protein
MPTIDVRIESKGRLDVRDVYFHLTKEPNPVAGASVTELPAKEPAKATGSEVAESYVRDYLKRESAELRDAELKVGVLRLLGMIVDELRGRA